MIFLKTMLMLIPVLMLAGCELSSADDFEDDETEFDNNASVAVTVTPEGDESFDAFVLQPGSRVFVERVGAQATFTYSPTDTVDAQEVSNEEVVFTDR
jgi:hypothetical protein